MASTPVLIDHRIRCVELDNSSSTNKLELCSLGPDSKMTEIVDITITSNDTEDRVIELWCNHGDPEDFLHGSCLVKAETGYGGRPPFGFMKFLLQSFHVNPTFGADTFYKVSSTTQISDGKKITITAHTKEYS